MPKVPKSKIVHYLMALVTDFEEETLLIVDALGKIGMILKERGKKEKFPLKTEEIQRNLGYVKEAQ